MGRYLLEGARGNYKNEGSECWRRFPDLSRQLLLVFPSNSEDLICLKGGYFVPECFS